MFDALTLSSRQKIAYLEYTVYILCFVLGYILKLSIAQYFFIGFTIFGLGTYSILMLLKGVDALIEIRMAITQASVPVGVDIVAYTVLVVGLTWVGQGLLALGWLLIAFVDLRATFKIKELNEQKN